MVTIEIPKAILDGIAERARGSSHEEICGGILRGVDYPVYNVAEEKLRSKNFLMDPQQQMDLFKEWGGSGDLIIYHSHPAGTTEPSKADKDLMAMNGRITFLIFAVKSGWFRAYRYMDHDRGIVEVRIVDQLSTQPEDTGTVTTGPTN